MQRDAIWRRDYSLKWVRWTVVVGTIARNRFGGYTLGFRCDQTHSLSDGVAEFANEDSAPLAAYGAGTTITFEGQLDAWTGGLVQVRRATVVSTAPTSQTTCALPNGATATVPPGQSCASIGGTPQPAP